MWPWGEEGGCLFPKRQNLPFPSEMRRGIHMALDQEPGNYRGWGRAPRQSSFGG